MVTHAMATARRFNKVPFRELADVLACNPIDSVLAAGSVRVQQNFIS